MDQNGWHILATLLIQANSNMEEFKKGSNSILSAILYRDGRQLISVRLENKLQIGRRDKSEPPAPSVVVIDASCKKIVAADSDRPTFPRSLVLLCRLDDAQVRISNIHQTALFSISGIGTVEAQQSRTVGIPATLILPDGFTLAIIETPVPSPERRPVEGEVTGLRTPLRLPNENVVPRQYNPPHTIVGMGDHKIEPSILSFTSDNRSNLVPIEAAAFLEILDFVVLTAQKPATSSEFYRGIAEAVTRLIDVDRAEVILRNDNQWERSPERTYCNPLKPDASHREPSYTMLETAFKKREMVVFPDEALDGNQVSLREMVTAVACPILDEEGGVLGILYADRVSKVGSGNEKITRIEETLIEILATAIATGIAKMKRESLVTTYQQFFSSKVIHAIRQNPKLLDGEDCEVTVLFCDIRGFSRITDRIGPAKAMAWIQDTLTALSSHVQNLDGVLVDYVGDEMFAMWGAPDVMPDHAVQAASAARLMMALSVELSDQWKKSIPEGFEFGIGLCTGTAHVGNIGSKQKFKYGPMGNTVNLGSRIQGLTSHWRVQTLMNEATALQLPPSIPKRRICQARVIGMEGSVTLYELGSKQDASQAALWRDYEKALLSYENGEHREAALAFSDLAKRYPKDGPSLMMLVRAVQELANPQDHFDPVWVAPSK